MRQSTARREARASDPQARVAAGQKGRSRPPVATRIQTRGRQAAEIAVHWVRVAAQRPTGEVRIPSAAKDISALPRLHDPREGKCSLASSPVIDSA
jgi:hypothetical protein